MTTDNEGTCLGVYVLGPPDARVTGDRHVIYFEEVALDGSWRRQLAHVDAEEFVNMVREKVSGRDADLVRIRSLAAKKVEAA